MRIWLAGRAGHGKAENFMLLLGNYSLTFILLMWTFGRAPNNASKWQMGFNSVAVRPQRDVEWLVGMRAHLNASYSGGSGFKSQPGDPLFWLRFQGRSRNFEKRLLASSCLSVRVDLPLDGFS